MKRMHNYTQDNEQTQDFVVGEMTCPYAIRMICIELQASQIVTDALHFVLETIWIVCRCGIMPVMLMLLLGSNVTMMIKVLSVAFYGLNMKWALERRFVKRLIALLRSHRAAVTLRS